MSQATFSRRSFAELVVVLITLAIAGISGALLFAIAEDGYSSFQQLGGYVLLPGIASLVVIGLLAWRLHWRWLANGLVSGAWMGAVSTIGLEIIRIIGFQVFHSMPGDLPTLMGVLLTGRIMIGPDTFSTFLGYADHFWNGATFGIIYVLLFGQRRWWIGLVYGFFLGTGFMVSPVVVAMGAGYFGSLVGPSFAITVYLAHLAFGGLLGWLSYRSLRVGRSIFGHFFGTPDTPSLFA